MSSVVFNHGWQCDFTTLLNNKKVLNCRQAVFIAVFLASPAKQWAYCNIAENHLEHENASFKMLLKLVVHVLELNLLINVIEESIKRFVETSIQWVDKKQ